MSPPAGPTPQERPSPPARLRLVRVRVPLRTPHRSARVEQHHRDSVLVGWTTPDGVEGWAECPTLSVPGYAGVTTDEAWVALVGTLGPAAVAGVTPPPLGAVAASAALADAALDAELRARGVSLADHLGARRRRLVRTTVLADPGADPGAAVGAAEAAFAGGAALVKCKVGPGAGTAAAAALAAELDPAALAVDANGTLAADAAALAAVDRWGLAYLEQPAALDLGWEAAAGVAAALATPVALDEPLTSVDAVDAALRAGAAGVVSVKPARLGGVAAAARAVAVAAAAGRPAFVGGMFELGIGRAAAAAVAALDGCTLPTDLGPSEQYVGVDVCDPVVVDADGALVVPDGPGCGRTPDPAVLERFSVASRELRATPPPARGRG